MKVVAYCIDKDEKILLAKANAKRHDITVISNALNFDTSGYADGKSAVILCGEVRIDIALLAKLKQMGVQLILSTFSIDPNFLKNAHQNYGLCIIALPARPINYGEIVRVLDSW